VKFRLFSLTVILFGFLAPKDCYIIWLSDLLTLSVPLLRLFQKRVVYTKLDIYGLFLSLCRYSCWWAISSRG